MHEIIEAEIYFDGEYYCAKTLGIQAVPNPTSMIPKQSKKQQKNDFIF